jgi:hypothetical protein
MIADPRDRRPLTVCETQGHAWNATAARGVFRCTNCQTIGYCLACLETVPKGAVTLRCQAHTKEQKP